MLVTQSVSKYKTVLNGSRTSLQIATSGGKAITSITCTGGSGGAAVRVSDSKNGAKALNSILVSANGGETSSFNPNSPIRMDEGIYAELTQSGGNAEATIFYN